MDTVTVSRHIDTDVDEVAEAVNELEPFVQAAGFDEVAVDENTIRVTNEVGPKRIELVLDVYDAPDAELAYEQREGIFETMTTVYALEPADGGTRITASTEFALDAAVVGPVLDATVIKVQRKRELTAQFDYLIDELDG